MALVLSSKEFAAYHKRLADQLRPTIVRGVHSGAARAVGFLVQRTRAAPPANPGGVGTGGAVNTGAFIRRWKSVRLPDGAELVNDSPYAGIVDPESQYGRRPGSKFPPRDALIAWIKRRLLTRPPAKRRKAGPRTPSDADRAKADAARVQKAARDFVRDRPQDRRPSSGSGKGRRAATADALAARMYFPIARAIAKRGLRGRRILHDPEAKRAILDFVRADVRRELEREQSKR